MFGYNSRFEDAAMRGDYPVGRPFFLYGVMVSGLSYIFVGALGRFTISDSVLVQEGYGHYFEGGFYGAKQGLVYFFDALVIERVR